MLADQQKLTFITSAWISDAIAGTSHVREPISGWRERIKWIRAAAAAADNDDDNYDDYDDYDFSVLDNYMTDVDRSNVWRN